MSKFQKDIFERDLRISKSELDCIHANEFKQFYEYHNKQGTIRGSYFLDKRCEIKGKHFKNILDIVIKNLIAPFPDNLIIEDIEIKEIKFIFDNYAKNLIENEKMGLQSFLASVGERNNSSVVVEAIKAFEYQLYSIKTIHLYIFEKAIDDHNKEVNRNKSVTPTITQTDKLINKLKNHKLIAYIIISVIIIVGIGSISSSFTSIQNLFVSKDSKLKEDSLIIYLKIKNEMSTPFVLSSLCQYVIDEQLLSKYNVLSQGRLYLHPLDKKDKDSLNIGPKGIKDYYVSFPSPQMYSTILDRGSANIYFMLYSPNSNNIFFTEVLPFERITLKKYSIVCILDSLSVQH